MYRRSLTESFDKEPIDFKTDYTNFKDKGKFRKTTLTHLIVKEYANKDIPARKR